MHTTGFVSECVEMGVTWLGYSCAVLQRVHDAMVACVDTASGLLDDAHTRFSQHTQHVTPFEKKLAVHNRTEFSSLRLQWSNTPTVLSVVGYIDLTKYSGSVVCLVSGTA